MLDLWHPTAAPRRRLALGAAAQVPDRADAGEAVDVAIVAPAAGELTRPWLERAISRAATRLAPDGVLWVIVPRRWRRSAERIVKGTDLVLLDAVLTLPSWPHTRHLIPVSPLALRHAAPRHVRLPSALTTGPAALARLEIARLALRRAARGCALVAGRSPGAAPLRWLGEVDGAGHVTATATIGPRSDARVAVFMRFTRAGSAPDVAVKVPLDEGGAARLARERAALLALAPEAREAGAAVPSLRQTTMPSVLVTGALPGRAASALLAARPGGLEGVVRTVAAWLESWNLATAASIDAGEELLSRTLMAPAEQVAEGGEAEIADYVEALRPLAARMQGRPLTLVAAHNDLTMSNVLLSDGRCGILDWEGAATAAPPLADLWYCIADAYSRACRITHAQAVEALVTGHGETRALTALRGLLSQHVRSLALSDDQALLGFHACWLHHARNELERGAGDGPFREVVRSVAAKRLLWPGPGDSPNS